MVINNTDFKALKAQLEQQNVTLVAVSKKQPLAALQQVYDYGQRDFGENYVQELVDKQPLLPQDVQWHFIGHLQRNKVKYIAPFIHLIQTVDSFSLLQEIEKEAAKNNRYINVLLQLRIAAEATKQGMDEKALTDFMSYYDAQKSNMPHVHIIGLMGMATFTEDQTQLRAEFNTLYNLFKFTKDSYFPLDDNFNTCSMGMSGDYELAISCGSNMVRLGTSIFGSRTLN